MAKITTPDSLYGNSRDILREAERENEILADIAGEEYESPGDIPKGKYVIEKRLLDAAQKKNELLDAIADGGGAGVGANKLAIDYGTDVLSLKKGNTPIADSGVTLPAYGVSFDPTTGGLTLTKNGTAMQGQTVTIPNYGSPVGVTDSADMVDEGTIYLYEGETGGGFTNGHFYYYDGSAWADGGEYAAATVQTDKTLLVEDRAADAKATGEAIGELKTQFDDLDETVNGVATINYVEGKKLDNDGTLSDDETVCVSEKIPYTWTGSTRYYCNDNTSTKYAICFYNSSDTLLKKVQLPSSTGGNDYRAYNAEDNVEGTVSYVRFSFKKGTTGEVRKNVSPDYELIWAALSTSSGGLVNDISEMQGEIDALQETAPAEGELEAIETELNGVTSFNYEDGKAIDSDGDVIDSAAGKSLTELIPIDGIPYTNPRFTYSDVSGDSTGTYYICFYDTNKDFIKAFSNNQNSGYRAISLETQVTGAKYVRFSFKTGVEANIAEHTDTDNIWWYANKTVVKGLKEKVDAAVVQNKEQVQAKAATVTNATITAIENIDIRKNLDIEFRGDITSFTDVVMGHGYNHNYAAYIKVDSTNITIYKDVLSGTTVVHTQIGDPIPHGLIIGTYLHVLIQQGDAGTATVTINTASGRFKQENVEFNGRRGNVFATITGTLTNAVLTASIRDLNKPVWVFGDSYQSLENQARWPYYLQNDGYLNNCLFSGFPGANSNAEIASFRKLISLAQPKYVVWGLGMNNSDNSAINVSWKQCVDEVINTCDNLGITVVLTTIPCVPDRDHTYKNAYIKNPPEGSPTVGKRYIDFARCVGAESAGSYWYNWGDDPASPDATAMLSSDKLHPSKYGAMALYAELLADMPEVQTYAGAAAEACDTLAGDFAATYVPDQAYAVGDYCTYQYQLYQCKTAIAANTDHTFVTSHWNLITVTDTINDQVDNLKNALGLPPDVVQWTDGCRYTITSNTDTIDPASPGISGTWRCAAVPCAPGTIFHISSISAGYNFRPYAFIDSSYNVLDIGLGASTGVYGYTNAFIIAPDNAAYAVFNDSLLTGTIVYTTTDKLQKNPLKSIIAGKKIVFMGDSLFGRFDGDDAIHSIISEKSGAITYNCGFGGTHAASAVSEQYIDWFDFTKLIDAKLSNDYTHQNETLPVDPSPTEEHYATHLALFKSIDFSKIDYLVISYGTNDWWGKFPIYEGPQYGPTFSIIGALQYGISAILTAYPNLIAVLCTPMYRCVMNNGVFVEELNTVDRPDQFDGERSLDDISAAISQLATDLKIPCCKFSEQLGVNQYTAAHYFDGSDGTHPNGNGRARMAQKLLGVLINS